MLGDGDFGAGDRRALLGGFPGGGFGRLGESGRLEVDWIDSNGELDRGRPNTTPSSDIAVEGGILLATGRTFVDAGSFEIDEGTLLVLLATSTSLNDDLSTGEC